MGMPTPAKTEQGEPPPQRRKGGTETKDIYKRRLLGALFLTNWDLANYQFYSPEHCSGRCPPGMYIYKV